MRIRKGDVLTFKPLEELHRLQQLGQIKDFWNIPKMDYLSIQQKKIVANKDIAFNRPFTVCFFEGWSISSDMLVKVETDKNNQGE